MENSISFRKALRKAGHKHELRYEKVDVNTLNKRKRSRRRYKRMFYFTPPYEMAVASSVGKDFLDIVKEEFPPDHPYHSILNEHTIKFSYSVMPNLKKKINFHNVKIAMKEREDSNNQNNNVTEDIDEDDDYDPSDDIDYELEEETIEIPDIIPVVENPEVQPPPQGLELVNAPISPKIPASGGERNIRVFMIITFIFIFRFQLGKIHVNKK